MVTPPGQTDDVGPPWQLPPLIVICGPTATGKTALGIELARRFDGEVVNADSRYFYRGMDIGVAKPTIAERKGVPHHLIDNCDLGEPDAMSLAVYQQLAFEAIEGIHARGRVPLLVGGTPLYLNAVVENWGIPNVPPDPAFRNQLEREIEASGVDPLLQRLHAVDPAAAERTGPNPRRIIRALEIYEATGRPMTELEGRNPPRFRTMELGLQMPRDRLYAVIDDRVLDQIDAGLEREVRTLLESGVPRSDPAFSALGYRQLFPVIDGLGSIEEAIRTIQHDTHRYVRHQDTWFRRNPRIVWIDSSVDGWRSRAVELVASFLAREPRPLESDQ